MNVRPIVYDLFCDASVGSDLRGTCAGCLVVRRPCAIDEINKFPNHMFYNCILPNGTNNVGESTAVAMATSIAIDLYHFMSKYGIYIVFNIFSDSLITIRGVREWIFNWIANIDENGNLFSSSGKPVANQERFKFIYNNILSNVSNPFHINYIHQKGHISDGNSNRMLPVFNKCNPCIDFAALGLTTLKLCAYNNYVDNETRCIITQYLNTPKSHRPIEWSDEILALKSAIYSADTLMDISPMSINKYRDEMRFYMPR